MEIFAYKNGDCEEYKNDCIKSSNVHLLGELVDLIGDYRVLGFRPSNELTINHVPNYTEIIGSEITKVVNFPRFNFSLRLDGGFDLKIANLVTERPIIGIFRTKIRLVKMSDELYKNTLDLQGRHIYQKDYILTDVNGLVVFADNHEDVLTAIREFANL